MTTRKNNHTGWTPAQRKSFLIASTKAGWNDQQRYLVMRYAGCPNDTATGNPSAKHPFNRGHHHQQCMAIAEAECKAMGVEIRSPQNHATWHELANVKRNRERELARAIAAEAVRKLPKHFDRGLLDHVVRHVADTTSHPFLPGVKPERLEQCDGATTHRVVECLRQFVGRKFHECEIRADCFEIPRRAIKRAERAIEAGLVDPPQRVAPQPRRSA